MYTFNRPDYFTPTPRNPITPPITPCLPDNSKEPKIRARMAKTTEEMIKQCMENAKRARARKEAVEKGEGSELEHFQVKI